MKQETSIIGCFIHIAREGDVIDTVTVSKDAYPDVTPATNWSDLSCCISASRDDVKNETPIVKPSPGGGYMQVTEEQVLQNVYLLNTEKTTPIYWELEEGFENPIVDGTPQIPGAKKDRYIQCWLKIQKRGSDGRDRIVKNIWGKLRLSEPFEGAKDPTRPVYRFEQEYSSIATSEPNHIAA